MNKIIVTGGALIKDGTGRILLQKRSDYGDWGLPGGAMEPGESIEETMIREVKEETGINVKEYNFLSVYTGKRMMYVYPDGNEVVFVMFLFEVNIDAQGLLLDDGKTLDYQDEHNESLTLQFFEEENIDIEQINIVQRPLFEDMRNGKTNLLRK
ncbi:DNA mismatch repair protein MutT [Solibacillus sp. R5-41]|uniref:NUDIX domain-containing protein n=1 Tax=Solibacillus sp. R5-41 TaxID=2048654 RepID=UPI000C124D28|nr:NUDIX domain-containing protein [Solibacillus sp. R5-41]ATP39978.1 DNA mismatch repair protein MutT [Solibacillus sp. R5-41]